MIVHTERIATEEGEFVARFSVRGLCQLRFPDGKETSRPDAGPPENAQMRDWIKMTRAALLKAVVGKAAGKLPPMDLSEGTEFQQEIWRALMRIPLGETMTYGEIASVIGRPKAVRAAGGACGANPIAVLIPCHRITAAQGNLGGFSGPKEWKRRLLQREGALQPELC
jgi:O-6-methylguanine DNA methyltransferase